MLSIFSCAYWPSVCLLWRNVYLDLLPIFWLGCLFCFVLFLILSSMSSLYILEIEPLSVILFANISPVHRLSLGVIYGFLCYANLLCLIRSQLIIFAFISFALGNWVKKILLRFMDLCQRISCLCSFLGGFLFGWLVFFLLHCAACGILVPRPGIKPVAPVVEVWHWSLNHWTSREFPFSCIFMVSCLIFRSLNHF